jgi:hypothetical protein
MTLPQFHSPALLQQDLRELGHDCDLLVLQHQASPKHAAARLAALSFLAALVDPAVAPVPGDPPAALDAFWAALGLAPLAPPPPDASASVRRAHGAAATAYMRAAVDLAFAARAVQPSDVAGFVLEDEEECSARTAVIDRLYSVFPGAVPEFAEPRFRPTKKRSAGAVGAPVLGRRNPVGPAAACGEKGIGERGVPPAGARAAAVQRRTPLGTLSFKNEANMQSEPAPRACGMDAAPAGGCDDVDLDGSDADGAEGDTEDILEEEETHHAKLLSASTIAEMDADLRRDAAVTYSIAADVEELASACTDAVAAASAYRAAADEALALSDRLPERPPRDPAAEATLAENLGPALEAHADVTASLAYIRRTRHAYSRVASAHNDSEVTAECDRAAKSTRHAAQLAERYSSSLLRSVKLRGLARPASLGRSVHLPAGQLPAAGR